MRGAARRGRRPTGHHRDGDGRDRILLERDLGVDAELALYTAVIDGSLLLEPLTTEDWTRVKELVNQHRGFPLGGTDASLMAIAERFKTTRIATLNHRHFRAVRPSHAPAFDLLPT